MQIHGLKTAAIAAIFAALTGSLSAQVISWNVDVYGTINANNDGAGHSTPGGGLAGVVLATNWNDAFYMNNYGTTASGLIDSLGNTTTVSYTLAYDSGTYAINFSDPGLDTDGSNNKRLLNGYLNNSSSAPETIALSGISYGLYDVYVYFSSDTQGRTGTVGVGSTTYDFSTIGPGETSGGNALFTQTSDTSGLNPSADYAVFSGLTGSSQTITLTPNDFMGIAGFQIVAVPEPGTLALVGMGGLAMLTLVRRRK